MASTGHPEMAPMTRRPAAGAGIAPAWPARMAGLAVLLAALTGCASFSPDGGFGVVQQAHRRAPGHPGAAGLGPPARRPGPHRPACGRTAGAAAVMDDASAARAAEQPRPAGGLCRLGITEAEIVQAGRLPNPGFSFGRTTAGDEIELERGLHLNLARLIALPLVQRAEAAGSRRCAAPWRCRCCRWRPTPARPGCRPWPPRNRCATAAR
jgi:hypothetical protein